MIWHCRPLQPVPPEPGQTWLAGQAAPPAQVAGQSSALPQPLPIVPQYCPPAIGVQLIGTQLGSPQTFGMPVPAQVCGAAQPQSMVWPQPSPIRPQYFPPPPGMSQPAGVQLAGTQTPSLLQVLPDGHAPQSSASPQPVPILPQ
jgi:hypothetical protein